jgi:hypothetical protein
MVSLTRARSKQVAASARLPHWCSADTVALIAEALLLRAQTPPHRSSSAADSSAAEAAIRAFVRLRSASTQTRAWAAPACAGLLRHAQLVQGDHRFARYMAGILRAWPHLMRDVPAMHRLIVLRELPMVRLLRRRRFDFDAPDPRTGYTALMEAAFDCKHALFMHLLDRRRVDPRARDAEGQTVRAHLDRMREVYDDVPSVKYRCGIMLRLLDAGDREVRRLVRRQRRIVGHMS